MLEKESAVGQHQTGHNSGVLHSGLYYKPGSLRARLAVTGIRQMAAFCRENGIAHEICGKLVVAADDTRSAAPARSGKARRRQRPGRAALARPRRDARDRAARGRRGGLARPPGRHRGLHRGLRYAGRQALGARRARRHRRPREAVAPARRGVDSGNHRRRVRRRFPDQLRRPAMRPRRPTGGRAARYAHRALPRRVLQAAPGAPAPGAATSSTRCPTRGFPSSACISRG